MKVIRTGMILEMKILKVFPLFYQVQFEDEKPKLYRKALFHGKDPVYEFQD